MRAKVLLLLLLLIVGVACSLGVAGRERGHFLEVGDKAILIMVDPGGTEMVTECTQEEDALRCVWTSP